MNQEPEFLSGDYWNNRYRQNQTGWDIGKVSTPIKEYIDQLTNKALRILIPGCGNAYEAKYLLEKGFTNITVVDISPAITDSLRKSLSDEEKPYIHIITDDFFEITGEYDLIIEQTFFCAIDPSHRHQYVIKTASLLSEKGKLTGLLFNREFESNPPFGGNEKEYRQLFSTHFRMLYLDECFNSISARAGTELFILAEKLNNNIP